MYNAPLMMNFVFLTYSIYCISFFGIYSEKRNGNTYTKYMTRIELVALFL